MVFGRVLCGCSGASFSCLGRFMFRCVCFFLVVNLLTLHIRGCPEVALL
jgi:hypothetical protein